jgi:K+-transporting ATPase KdpF subunit
MGATLGYIVAFAIAVAVTVYLVAAMIFPERF